MKIEYDENRKPKIGGFLYLIGLISFISIIKCVVYTCYGFNVLGTIPNTSIPYNEIKFEILYYIIMSIFSIYIFWSFCIKNKSFPLFFITFFAIETCYNIISYQYLQQYNISPNYLDYRFKYTVSFSILSCILFLYIISSKRVKYTFETNINNNSNTNSTSSKINNDSHKDIDNYFDIETNDNIAQAKEVKIIILCPHCSQKIAIPEHKWLQITCPRCKTEFEINQQ